MIDLHCHLLPGIDDGARDLATSLEMARLAVADGIRILACTPHITPGIYDNDGPQIRRAVEELASALYDNDIDLYLVTGADVHLAPRLIEGMRSGHIPTIADSRYFLLEPPHHIVPQRMDEVVADLCAAGYVPVITHPERLSWIETRYSDIKRMVAAGAWIQLTAGSITGKFGSQPRYWAERMLDEGIVHLVASDAHNTGRRRPSMGSARDAVAARLGEAEGEHVSVTRPLGIVKNLDPNDIVAPPGLGVAGGVRAT
ncbi:protein-tyrosine phosphatase [Amorphus suaedae]